MAIAACDLVMPVIARDLAYFKTFYASYTRFWNVPGSLRLFVRNEEKSEFLSFTQSDSRVVLHSKEDLLGSFPYNEPQVPGWYRQQMVKVGAASIVQTPVYLAIDADVFVARDVKKVDERLPVEMVECDFQRHYYVGSSVALYADAPVPKVVPVWRPPFFFDTKIMRFAIDRMEEQALWTEVLSNLYRAGLRFGEVFIYHVAAKLLGLWDARHLEGPAITHDVIQRYPYNDAEDQFSAWSVEETFSGQYMFGVVQSCTRISADRVAEKLKEILK